ncbi:tetratricopeptide repeat protein [Chamaesiphon minutus]|uniref:Tetratricopeptide repeat protein n=1 Tax=Chamaesiphon minutus (strain ATCC 27169 / PCC 6605) TaxID=1173020 RepID=K9UHA2_CHAP6|nr:tetratricopeptide repeat protein [Chamaesiphon minutus]AFY94190.1 tetratricopeptide repeat protein [Chamaesiphon minutus PCC 6605]
MMRHSLIELRFSSLPILTEKSYLRQAASHDRSLAIEPNDPTVWYNRGNSLLYLEKYPEAIASYHRAILFEKGSANEIDPKLSAAWGNCGVALDRLGRYLEAIDCYREAVNIAPNYSEAWCNWGVALGRLECYADALACFDRALAIHPDDLTARTMRNLVLTHLDRSNAAISTSPDSVSVL